MPQEKIVFKWPDCPYDVLQVVMNCLKLIFYEEILEKITRAGKKIKLEDRLLQDNKIHLRKIQISKFWKKNKSETSQ